MSDINAKFIGDDAVVIQVKSGTMVALPCGCLGFCAGRCKAKTKAKPSVAKRPVIAAAGHLDTASRQTQADSATRRSPAPTPIWEAIGPVPPPDYERGGVRLYRADALDVLPYLYERGHVIFDAPYSRKLHEAAEVANALPDGATRQGGFDFSYLTPRLRRALARHAARLASRWVLVFSESESPWLWRMSLVAAGLKYHSTGYWIKRGGRPNFKGDGPGVAAEPITVCQRDQRVEPITICHGRPNDEERDEWKLACEEARATGRVVPKAIGKSRWNCGGDLGVWEHPIVHDTDLEERTHATPKPPKLMIQLVEDFTDPAQDGKEADLIYDFTAGAFTTALGCIRAAGGPRRFCGFERDPEVFARGRDRIDAELDTSTFNARKRQQFPLFPDRGATR